MAKHFPGYGSLATDAHKGIAEITKPKDLFFKEDVYPLKALIDAGIDGIMTGHAITRAIDGEYPATMSGKMLTGVLRQELGYNGLVETDAMRMSAIQNRYTTAAASVAAVAAGCDLILLRGDFEHFTEGYDAIFKAVNEGTISEDIIGAAVIRILNLKKKLGLFENRFADKKKAADIVGCTEHREISKELAEKSVKVLRAKNIPLAPNGKIAVISVAPQKLGATLDKFQNVEMLINAVREKAQNADGISVKLNPDGKDIKNALSLSENADAVIVGVCNAIIYKNQKNLVETLYKTGKKIITVAIDSPFDIEEFPYIENYICTYGVAYDWMVAAANVIFGDKHE
jgi:beta-N-acetylhexosaminidase